MVRSTPGCRKTAKWLTVAVVAIAATTAVFHASFLRCLASFLVADEPIGDFQYIGVLEWHNLPDGYGCYDEAAELHRQKPARNILLLVSRHNRLVETDVLPSFESLSRRQLEARGLPPRAVTAIRGDRTDDWATARTLRTWLAARPDVSVLLLCGSLRSAHLRFVLDAMLDPQTAARVRLRALSDRQCDQANWWTSRTGIKAFGIEWLRLLHGWCLGGDYLPPPYRSADDYERDARRTLTQEMP